MKTRRSRNPEKRGRFARIFAGMGRVFRAQDGKLRVVWRLLLACSAYVAWLWGATYALDWYFGVLFARMGLTTANIFAAPAWARTLALGYGTIVSFIVNAGALALALGAYRLFSGKTFAWKPNAWAVLVGLASGGLLAGAPAAIFLAADSVRIEAVYGVSVSLAVMLAVYFVACMAEECFCRVLAFDMVRERCGGSIARLVSCGLFFLAGSGWALGWIGALNLLLMGLVCCELYDVWGVWASLSFRVAWSFVSAALLQFPGNTSVSRPLVALYAVSDSLWTGGESGLISGLCVTILLAMGILVAVARRISHERTH